MPMPDDHKNKVSLEAIKAALEDGHGKNDGQIRAAIARAKADDKFDARRSELTEEVWDRVSPINGVPAQHFLDRADVDENGDDDIILIKKGGRVVQFQPHEPKVSGMVRIGKGNGLAKGKEIADRQAASAAVGEVVSVVAEDLGVGLKPPPSDEGG